MKKTTLFLFFAFVASGILFSQRNYILKNPLGKSDTIYLKEELKELLDIKPTMNLSFTNSEIEGTIMPGDKPFSFRKTVMHLTR